MSELLLLISGIALGAYFAEPIREVVPVLKPSESTSSETAE